MKRKRDDQQGEEEDQNEQNLLLGCRSMESGAGDSVSVPIISHNLDGTGTATDFFFMIARAMDSAGLHQKISNEMQHVYTGAQPQQPCYAASDPMQMCTLEQGNDH